jgi:hypothetical protein
MPSRDELSRLIYETVPGSVPLTIGEADTVADALLARWPHIAGPRVDVDVLDLAIRRAQSRAIDMREIGHVDRERDFLDLLALLERIIPDAEEAL